MNIDTKWLFGAVMVLCLIAIKLHMTSLTNTSDNSLIIKLKTLQHSGSQIVIYGPATVPQTITGAAYLDIYGIKERVVPVSNSDELMKAVPSITPQDISEQKVIIPVFVLPDGQRVDATDLYAALSKLEVVNLHPGKKSPYIILYGVKDCPYTARAKQQLDYMNIPYEYVDLNSDAARYMGELQARLAASGYKQDNYNVPLLEINGYVRPRDYVPEMIRNIQVKQ